MWERGNQRGIEIALPCLGNEKERLQILESMVNVGANNSGDGT